jgi:hypothetical protein
MVTGLYRVITVPGSGQMVGLGGSMQGDQRLGLRISHLYPSFQSSTFQAVSASATAAVLHPHYPCFQ